jgi:hypothetical protein
MHAWENQVCCGQDRYEVILPYEDNALIELIMTSWRERIIVLNLPNPRNK